MEKICFDCGVKDQQWTGPVFSSAEKLKAFYEELGVSDPLIDKMQTGDLLCSKCVVKAECRHALKFYNYYQEKWTPEQYEIWAKNNARLISIAESELKEPERADTNSTTIVQTANIPNEINVKAEKLAVIKGNPIEKGHSDSSGQAIIDSELAIKFEAFCAAHKGKIIDWNTSQEIDSGNWFIFIRYTD
ncbi:MAG: hypothetical protein OEM79_06940 [Nitrosopumilus sp.]|nr:hypothetical protein [Nitrosopumilus sp.]